MKAIKSLLTIAGSILVLSLVMLSCRTAEIAAVSCPEFSGSKSNKVAPGHKILRNGTMASNYRLKIKKQPVSRVRDLSKKNRGKDIVVFKNSTVLKDILVSDIGYENSLSKIEYLKGLTASNDNTIIQPGRNNSTDLLLKKADMTVRQEKLNFPQPSGCDTIVLKSGSMMIVKVAEIVQNEIRYRYCNNLNGPITSISKSVVSVIKYPNGTRDFFISDNASSFYDNYERRETESFGITGFVASMIGGVLMLTLIGAGYAVIMAPIGIVFGAISLGRIKKHPEKYKGKKLAKASIILGLIEIIVFIGLVIWLVSSSNQSM